MRFNAHTHAARYVDVARALGVRVDGMTAGAAAEAAIARVEALARVARHPRRAAVARRRSGGLRALRRQCFARRLYHHQPSPVTERRCPRHLRRRLLTGAQDARAPDRGPLLQAELLRRLARQLRAAGPLDRDAGADLHRSVRRPGGAGRPVRCRRRGRGPSLRRAVGGDDLHRRSGARARSRAHVVRRGPAIRGSAPGSAPAGAGPGGEPRAGRGGPVMIDAAELGGRGLRAHGCGRRCRRRADAGPGELAGVLAVGSGVMPSSQPTDVSILVTLANHAGVALHNAQLFAQSELGAPAPGGGRPPPAAQPGAQPDRPGAARLSRPASAHHRHEPGVVSPP